MILSHFSKHERITPYSVEQPEREMKPKGLWVSVDGEDDWESWCRAEDFGDIDSQYRHRVTLAPGHRVLVLVTPDDVLEFARPYDTGDSYRLDWARVAADHAGVIIAPYQWSLRMDRRTCWYYGWDCASGCIWDASAIADVTLIQPARAES